MHFHVRNDEGRHSLDAGLYREALKDLEAEQGLLYQISSEGLGHYAPCEQARCVFESGCRFASVAWREMNAGEQDRAAARRFYEEARERSVHLQHILYAPCDAVGLWRMVEDGVIDGEGLCVLFVYGEYGRGIDGMPPLDEFLDACLRPFGEVPLWFLCGFGIGEGEYVLRGARRGGHVRVGFENNVLRGDGGEAEDNAERVAEVVAGLRECGQEVVGVRETRALLGVQQPE